MAITIQMHDLLESGAHFGHQKRRWNPKMKKYIFEQRNGTNIIDLQQTVSALKKAYNYVKAEAAQGKVILLIGTKKQAKDTISRAAKDCGMPYVNSRWLGGTLTNFRTVQKSIQKLKELATEKNTGYWDKLPKKEVLLKQRILDKLEKNLGGIKEITCTPDILYIVDVLNEDIAVKEANKKDIPIVAIVDTNADPDLIDWVVPANDDAIKSIKYITSVIADAVKEGRKEYEGTRQEEQMEEAAVEETAEVADIEDKVSDNDEVSGEIQPDKISDEK